MLASFEALLENGWVTAAADQLLGCGMPYQKTHKYHVTSADICLIQENWIEKRGGKKVTQI